MARQPINTGTTANDGTGDTFRAAMTKSNENFTELYAREEMTAGDAAKLAGVEPNATADQTGSEIVLAIQGEADANLLSDAQIAALSDIRTTEQLQDLIAAMFQGGTHSNVSVVYDDADGTIDLTSTAGGGGGTLTQEQVEDFVASVTVSGTGINVEYDDPGNTLTISLVGEVFTTADHNKLDGIAAQATRNTGALADLDQVGLAQVADGILTLAKFATAILQGDGTKLLTIDSANEGEFLTVDANGKAVGQAGTDATSFAGILGFDGAGAAIDVATKAALAARITDLDYVNHAQANAITYEEIAGTAYTLVTADAGKTKGTQNGSATTVTIPTNASDAIPIGSKIDVIQIGAGTVTITADTGVTLNGVSAGSGEVSGQFRDVTTLIKIAADEWLAVGGIEVVA